ncbi:MAG: DUF4258 domain-containing protein [Rhodobacteraceae bacterium]|nr:DUF4258 domain-containing protein [Paracoccaceae bacterium]
MKPSCQPWNPGQATGHIREIAANPELDLTLTKHARERMAMRRIIISDVLWILRNGFVRDENSGETTVSGLFKYVIGGMSPNSSGRVIRIVVIPDAEKTHIKVVTVMWKDS